MEYLHASQTEHSLSEVGILPVTKQVSGKHEEELHSNSGLMLELGYIISIDYGTINPGTREEIIR